MNQERIDALIRAQQKWGGSALAILKDVQAEFGYLSEDVIAHVARETGRDPAQLAREVSLFSVFRTAPLGRYHLRLCGGPSCKSRASWEIRDAILSHLSMTTSDYISPDRRFSLVMTGCAFQCSRGPILWVNDDLHERITAEDAIALLDALP